MPSSMVPYIVMLPVPAPEPPPPCAHALSSNAEATTARRVFMTASFLLGQTLILAWRPCPALKHSVRHRRRSCAPPERDLASGSDAGPRPAKARFWGLYSPSLPTTPARF